MTMPSDTVTMYVPRQTAAGAPAYSRLSSDFVVSRNGVLVTISSLTEIGVPVGSLFCWYSFTVTELATTGLRLYTIEPAQNAYSTDYIGAWYGGEIEAYDLDSLAGLMLQQQGIPGVRSAADSNLGDIVDKDTYISDTLTMPLGKLSPHGITDISAAGITLQAAVMASAGGTSYPITATVVSGPGLTFNIRWSGGTSQPFPALVTTTPSMPQFIDVQILKTGAPNVIITTNRYTFTQVWERESRIV